MRNYLFVLFLLFFGLNISNAQNGQGEVPIKVEIKKEQGEFKLYKNSNPYFIKGAVGWDFLEELKAAGANSLRTSPKLLDEAYQL